jgi:ferrochelatase
MESKKPIGIVLLQLGGPDSLDSVEPFLRNLFNDPNIIDLPLAFLFRASLAKMIARLRSPHVREIYRRIGGRSPLLKLTRRQAAALEKALQPEINARVVIAMRYWHPMSEAAMEELSAADVERVILLPLYPQYSKSTTASSIMDWEQSASRMGKTDLMTDTIEQYCDHPLYVGAIVRNIRIALRRLPVVDRQKVHLVFSAHGTPLKLVRGGDPYQQQIVRTYTAVIKEGKFGLRHSLCYQSKVGPEKWLEPSFEWTLTHLAGNKVSHVIVVPISFVSDHSETLWEINIQGKSRAKELGIKYFDMSPALHTSPEFIGALKDLVLREVHA